MPLGAIMSAPASAWDTAVLPYSSMVSSFMTYPSLSRTPQCPWSVYSHRHRSAMTSMSEFSFKPAMAFCTTPSLS